MADWKTGCSRESRIQGALLLLTGALFVCLGWSTFLELGCVYLTDSDYSHGFLIPLIAGYVALHRFRRTVSDRNFTLWPGLALTALGIGTVIL